MTTTSAAGQHSAGEHSTDRSRVRSGVGSRLVDFARDIKLSHTVFALPFALLSTFLGPRTLFDEGKFPAPWPKAGQLLLIVLCMVMARTVAMASNRLLDAELDRRNPRTAGRAIPSGRLSRRFFAIVLVGCAIAF